jgi:hypothetical protein
MIMSNIPIVTEKPEISLLDLLIPPVISYDIEKAKKILDGIENLRRDEDDE